MKLDNEATIRIVQINKSRWQIETRHGYVLQNDLHFKGVLDAESYVKGYLSSWSCWRYEVVPLKKEKKK